MEKAEIVNKLIKLNACDSAIEYIQNSEDSQIAWLNASLDWKWWLVFRLENSIERLGLLIFILEQIKDQLIDPRSQTVLTALREAQQGKPVDWRQIRKDASAAYAADADAAYASAAYAAYAAYAADAAYASAAYAAAYAADAADTRKQQNDYILSQYPFEKIVQMLESYEV